MEEKTKKIRYQLYKPELKEYDTVELEIIGSHEIPCSLYKRYSVTVCHKSPGRKQEHLTSKKMSLWGPLKWNEKFTFRREKSSQDWTFDFQLKATSWLSVSLVGKKTEVLKKIGEAVNVELVKSNDTKINLEVRLEEKESKQDVRIRDQEHLCDDENKFCGERKSVIQKSHFFTEILTDQTQKTYQKEHLPNIAVIGSGGGMRAVQGMSGAVIALDEAHILDAVMYMAGVSGSSWLKYGLQHTLAYTELQAIKGPKMNSEKQFKQDKQQPNLYTK